jgi:hypothetical protein
MPKIINYYLKDRKRVREYNVDDITIWFIDPNIREPAGRPRKPVEILPPPPYQLQNYNHDDEPNPVGLLKHNVSETIIPEHTVIVPNETSNQKKVPLPPAWRPYDNSVTFYDKKWNKKFEQLLQFRYKNKRWPKKLDGALGRWCDLQRTTFKGKVGPNGLAPERYSKLEEIGFDWGTSTVSWNKRFEEVKRFYDEHQKWPSCRSVLGQWCQTQRQANRGKHMSAKMSAEKIKKLDTIGFDWGSTKTRWDENFEEVRRFHDEHGRWPPEKKGGLGKWCDTQRQAKKGKGSRIISPARIAKLDGIGFAWDRAASNEERWDANFKEMLRFRVEHGRWPKFRDGALGTWCHNQRQAKKGKWGCRISLAQIAKLDGVGFDMNNTLTDVSAELTSLKKSLPVEEDSPE